MKQINWGRIGCGNVTEVNEFESGVVGSGSWCFTVPMFLFFRYHAHMHS